MLGYCEWLDGLSAASPPTTPACCRRSRRSSRSCSCAGWCKAVFATETLALGINMPARIGGAREAGKCNGETHADITPGEYTQLTGRAGRRGIDVEGHAVVLWQPGLDPRAVAGLASTRTYPLRSRFRPSYNMAVNLVDQSAASAPRELLESSFAQFQADRAVVGLARQLRDATRTRSRGTREAVTCDLGDFMEYAALRAQLTETEKDAVEVAPARPSRRTVDRVAGVAAAPAT